MNIVCYDIMVLKSTRGVPKRDSTSTRKVWIYFLKNKSDVFATFKRWKVEVENQTSQKVKSLRFDNGGEYDSHEFKDFCAEYGI